MLPHHRLHFLISIKLYPVYSSIFSFSSIISTSCLRSFSQNSILHFFYISFNVFIIPYVLHLYNSHRNFYCNSNIIVIITAQLEANILTTSFSCIHNITKTYMHLQYHFHQYLIVLTLPYTYYKSL